MDSWKPRPHDHLVEPVFGGLGAQHDAGHDEQRALELRRSARAWRALLAAAIFVGVALAVRVWMLL